MPRAAAALRRSRPSVPLLGQSRCVWLTDGGCRHAGIDGLEIIDPDEDPENYAQRAAEQCAAASRRRLCVCLL